MGFANGKVSAPPVLPAWVPWSGQRRGIKFLIERNAAGLLFDPGFGKTSITLAAFKILRSRGMAQRLLIIAPPRPMQNVWVQEAAKWRDFSDLKVARIHSDYGKKEEIIRSEADVFVINNEGLPWLAAEHRYKLLAADVMCIDELSKFKHSNTGRFKLMRPIIKTFARRWGLTGSPNPNGYIDLFGQAFMLDGGNALGQYITHYRTKYFIPSGYGGYDWKLAPGAEKKIQEVVKPLFLRLDVTDYIDVPKVMPPHVIYVDLPSAARKVYDAMEDELIAELQTGEKVTAVSAAVASIKCRQIANGCLYLEGETFGGKRLTEVVHDEKAKALAELIDELQGSPVLVGYQFGHDLVALQRALGKDAPYIGGGVSGKRSGQLIQAWNAGELPYLLAQTAAVAHGLNLQGSGNHVAMYGLTWNYEDYEQFIRRVARQGSKHTTVFIHHILARNTIEDTGMVQALHNKGVVQRNFLEALQARRGKVKLGAKSLHK